MLHKKSATALLLMAAVTSACTLQTPDAPLPTGPSEMSLSLTITATPDIIFQDGGSQALITIVARDANSQPVPGLNLLVQTSVNGNLVDYGTLSAKSLVTDLQGRATVVYTAPAPPPATQTSDGVVRIVVTPIGVNYDSTMSRDVSIRLSRPGVITLPNDPPVASFTVSPDSADAGDVILFDASDSDDPDGSIVQYRWNWGDGDTDTTTSAIEQHDYDVSGTYAVTLTVTDNDGATASATRQVSIATAPTPTAVFTFSPQSPTPGSAVNFNASESTAPEGRTIVEYRWNWGDGTADVVTSSATTSHVFGAEGDYVVTLTVVDSDGARRTVSQTVTVES